MTGLLITRGISFRYGDSGSKDFGNFYSYDGQIQASTSQHKLLDYVKSNFDVQMDVVVDTITTKYDSDLLGVFEDRLIRSNIKPITDPTEYDGLRRTILETYDLYENYDFVFLVRNDILFKTFFFQLFSPFDKEIKFPNLCAYNDRKTPLGNPRVNNPYIFVPKKYYHCLKYLSQIGKDKYKTHNELDFFLEADNNIVYSFYLSEFIHPDIKQAVQAHPLHEMINRKNYDYLELNGKYYPEDF